MLQGLTPSPRGRVLYGLDAIHELPGAVSHAGWRRVLLVCGKRSFETSGAVAMFAALSEQVEVRRLSDFSPNPDSLDLEHGLAVLKAFPADAVVAVGGGSAMDMAKLLCAYDGMDGGVALAAAVRQGATIMARERGLGLIPTTSGSGSEATHFAVVYIGHEKFSIAGPALRADLIILDPQLVRSGSAHQRACSGVDAICQAIESLWAVGADARSSRFARRALGLLVSSIEPFVQTGSLQSARAMCIGSHLAGRAIDVSKTTVAHALSYSITKQYGLNHGYAVAVTLGRFIEAHDRPDVRLQPGTTRGRLESAMGTILKALSARDGAEGRRHFEGLLRRIGLDPSLAAHGISTNARRAKIVASVNVERLANNPVAFSANDLERLLGTD